LTYLQHRRPLTAYFTIDGIRARVVDSSRLYLCLTKELIDNALDATPTGVTASMGSDTIKGQAVLALSILGDGQPFSKENITERFTHLDEYVGSKIYWRLPKRGVMGDALRITLGVPYALAKQLSLPEPEYGLKIASYKQEATIKAEVNWKENAVETPEILWSITDIPGVKVSTRLPIIEKDSFGLRIDRTSHYLFAEELEELLKRFLLFNTNTRFRLQSTHARRRYRVSSKSFTRYADKTSIRWYDFESFRALVTDAAREPETLNTFVQYFHGVTGTTASLITNALNITDLAKLTEDESHIHRLYDLLKMHGTAPKPSELGHVGKDDMEKYMKKYTQGFVKFDYAMAADTAVESDYEIPYVIEVGVAKKPYGELELVWGINHSPCLEDPIDSFEDLGKTNIYEIFHNHDIETDTSVTIAIHIISPFIEYTDTAKGKVNPRLFGATLAQCLDEALASYERHKRRRGMKSDATEWLEKWLQQRQKRLKAGEDLSKEMVTRNTLWYLMRKEVGYADIERDTFLDNINNLCKELGGGDEKHREMLGIYAAERGKLYFRGGERYIGYDSYRFLAEKGCDILLIEKEGIAEMLAHYATDYGVAIVNSRGFATHYVRYLFEEASRTGTQPTANLFSLTDYDDSGIAMAKKIPNTVRIGLDQQMLDTLKIEKDDVAEDYTKPPEKRPHFNQLTEEEKKQVKDKRVELDSLMAYATPQEIWEYLKDSMSTAKKTRDLTRSIELHEPPIPHRVKESLDTIHDTIRAIGAPLLEKEKSRYSAREQAIQNIALIEKEILKTVETKLERHNEIKRLTAKLRRTTNTLARRSPQHTQHPGKHHTRTQS